MIPSKGGCFELTVGGKLLYSKLKTGEFPDEDASMIRAVGEALGRLTLEPCPARATSSDSRTRPRCPGRKKRLTDYANCAG